MRQALRLCVQSLLVWCWMFSTATAADDLARLQGAVVKITSELDGRQRTGAGVVVKIESETVYIVTAAHVVEGDKHPLVEFFARRNATSKGDVLRLEGGDPKGLALLAVRGKESFPSDLPLLAINSGSALAQGDEVTAIGFPKGGGPWSVSRMTVNARDGRDLIVSGTVDEGNSGGPVIWRGEIVALMVTMRDKFGVSVPGDILQATLRGWGGAWSYGCLFAAPAGKLHAPPIRMSLEAKRFYQQAQTFQDEKRFGDAIRMFGQAARLGHFVATTDLAFLTWSGMGVPQDQGEALRLFNGVCQAAKEGQPMAQAAVGRSYLVQHPWLIKDNDQAMAWMRAAAEQGQEDTQISLGSIYLNGKGVPQDFGEAVKWFRRAAESGDVFGQYNLARMYSAGRGVDQNLETAVYWYRKSAAQGLAGAITALGIAHLDGLGAPRDEALAGRLLQSSAQSGDSNAQYRLATMLASGRGVPQDLKQAIEWWRKSAKQGDKRAQQELSRRGIS